MGAWPEHCQQLAEVRGRQDNHKSSGRGAGEDRQVRRAENAELGQGIDTIRQQPEILRDRARYRLQVCSGWLVQLTGRDEVGGR